ncbi:MAG: ComEC/Rec2 family competence protein [Microbacteriaceae bacterium]
MNADLRLPTPAATAWLAAGILIAAPRAAAWVALGLWLAAIAAIVILIAQHRLRTLLGILSVCLIAGALTATAVAVAAPARQPDLIRAGPAVHQVEATVRVTGNAQSASLASTTPGAGGERQFRFRGMLTRVQFGQRLIQLAAPVQVFATAPAVATGPAGAAPAGAGPAGAGPAIGSVLRVRGELAVTRPEESDAFRLFGRGRPEVIEAPPWYLDWANRLRSSFSNAAAQLPGDGGGLLPGLAIGDTTAVGPVLDAEMKTSSLSHLTAVSGANCAVIMGLIMLLGAALGLRRGVRIALALTALTGFVILVTPGPSVLRAAVMASIIVFSAGAGRPGRGVAALSLAVIVLLVADPWFSRNYGFSLSVLATAGLLVLAGPLARALARWMPVSVAALVSIPLAAQLACQPVLILLNPALPLYGVAANLLAEPAAPAATVLGLIACVLLPVFPVIAMACAQLAWIPSAWIASVATLTAGLPGSQLPWAGGLAGALLLALAVALWLIVALRPTGARWSRLNVSALVALIVLGACYGGSAIGSGIGSRLSMPPDWQIAACDIGQGDAVLVRDGGSVALIDVGPDPKLLADCLETLGIGRIGLLVLSHYDLDHVGGLAAVLGRVDTALVGTPADAGDQALIDALAKNGAGVTRAHSGDRGTLDRLNWRVLWPRAGSKLMQTGNEGCVTVQFDGAGISSLFLCDLGERAQDAVLATHQISAVDVVKVAHHGSADQSERMYRTLRARLGVISVGAQNDYGHPTGKLLGILGRQHTIALRTDLDGMVLIAPTGRSGELTVWSQRQPPAESTSRPHASENPDDGGRG